MSIKNGIRCLLILLVCATIFPGCAAPTQRAVADLSPGSRIAVGASKTLNGQTADTIKQAQFQMSEDALPGVTAAAAPAGAMTPQHAATQHITTQYAASQHAVAQHAAPRATFPIAPATPAWPYSQPPSKPEPEPTSSCSAGCCH